MRKKIEIKQKNCQKIEGDILLIMVTKDIINMIRVSKLFFKNFLDCLIACIFLLKYAFCQEVLSDGK